MTLLSIKNICISICATVLMVSGSSAIAEDVVTQEPPNLAKWISKDANWALRLPKDDKIDYRGKVNLDKAGMHGASILYPAPGPAGFLTAVITHGVLVESLKNGQKSKLQAAADKVLSPYEAILSSFGQRDLMQRSLTKTTIGGSKRLVGYTDKPVDGLVIDSEPVFSMTQDQSALVLDNSVSIFTSDAPSVSIYQNKIRVVSQAKDGTDLTQFWMADKGENLKEESASLLAESLDVVLTELGSPSKNNIPYKTIRYMEGHSEQMERGQIIADHCDRVVLKNLRGWFMSVPARPQGTDVSTTNQCDISSVSLP